jgi:hypothetical protein
MPERELTPKELNVVDTFEQARPGLGAMPSAVREATIAQSNILNPNSGWREIIADMPESEIVCREGTNSNNGFMYRHIGH